LMGALLYGPYSLKRPIFKWKKGFANISLGLNYCSMGSSLPRFRDTVPLNSFTTGTSLFSFFVNGPPSNKLWSSCKTQLSILWHRYRGTVCNETFWNSKLFSSLYDAKMSVVWSIFSRSQRVFIM
jgi:hypothetical protein